MFFGILYFELCNKLAFLMTFFLHFIHHFKDRSQSEPAEQKENATWSGTTHP